MNPLPRGSIRRKPTASCSGSDGGRADAIDHFMVASVRTVRLLCPSKAEQRFAGGLIDALGPRGGSVAGACSTPLARVDHAPDAAAFAVAAGMVQRHFVMADDAVVKIGDVQGAVRADQQIRPDETKDRRRSESRAARSPCRSSRVLPVDRDSPRPVTTLPMKIVSRYSAGNCSAA